MKLTLLFTILIVVTGQVLYHVITRSASDVRSPFELVLVAYLTGVAVVGIAGFSTNQISFTSASSFQNVIKGVGIGIAVALVEIGYVYAYKRGLPIATGAVSVLAMTSLLLAPIGVIFFDETLTVRMIFGALLTLVGVWLMTAP